MAAVGPPPWPCALLVSPLSCSSSCLSLCCSLSLSLSSLYLASHADAFFNSVLAFSYQSNFSVESSFRTSSPCKTLPHALVSNYLVTFWAWTMIMWLCV